MYNILVIGSRERLDEFRKVELKNASVEYFDQFYLSMEEDGLMMVAEAMGDPDDPYYIPDPDWASYDIIFDLDLDEAPENIFFYGEEPSLIVIGGAARRAISGIGEVVDYGFDCRVYGMNTLPTFIDKETWELSVPAGGSAEELRGIMEKLGRKCEIVEDRVGLVTPRVLCMIINEACFVLQEGTAGVAAVDQAMKLGTNYPMGPFEWADKIGLRHVRDVVEALFEDMKDSKYRIAPLLKHYASNGMTFYGKQAYTQQ